MIIGERPGKVRKGTITQHVWIGNRSADLMQEIIKGFTNLYLTNVFNKYVGQLVSKEHYRALEVDGVIKLMDDIKRLKPVAIFCFGNEAHDAIDKIRYYPNMPQLIKNVVTFPHPSSILRFHRGTRSQYVSDVRYAINLVQGNEPS